MSYRFATLTKDNRVASLHTSPGAASRRAEQDGTRAARLTVPLRAVDRGIHFDASTAEKVVVQYKR